MQKKTNNPAITLTIGEDANGKGYLLRTATVRNIGEANKRYPASAFPRTEVMNVRGWAEWGSGDNLPQQIDKRLASVPFAKQVLYKMAQEQCGKGIVLVNKKDFYEGNFVRTYHKEAVRFNERNLINSRWLFPQALNKLMFANSFTQFDLTAGGKVDRMFHLDSMYSRLSKQNAANKEIEYHLYSGKFGTSEIPRDEDIRKLPLFRWYKDDFTKWLKGLSYVWHTQGTNVGTTYYARPIWINALEKNGWFDTAANVPKLINALSKGIKPRWRLKASMEYFKFRHKNWDSLKDEERNTILDAFEAKIEEGLAGVENAGKLITTYHLEENGKLIGAIELEPITDDFKENQWLPSSLGAKSEIIDAFGYHASQMSMMSDNGKGMGAGSGSDARVHFNSSILRNTMEQLETLEPLNHAYAKNGFDVVAMIDDLAQTTTDNSKTGIADPKKDPKTPQ